MFSEIHKTMFMLAAAFALAFTPVSALAGKPDPERVVKTLPKTPQDLDLVDVGTVTNVLNEEQIELDSGKVYSLDQVRIPLPYNGLAVNYLKRDLLNRTVGIYVDKNEAHPRKDRDGNLYAHILRDDGVWIQAVMVGKGLAWAYSTPNSRKLIIPLYTYEAKARKAFEGFWADNEYRVKKKAEVVDYLNSYQLYECHITHVTSTEENLIFLCNAALVKKKVVWPFSFSLSFKNLDRFTVHSGSDLRNKWRGAIALVHGWVKKDTSLSDALPNIEITHPEQIEFIDPDTGESTTQYD